jgi:hypothetical protein
MRSAASAALTPATTTLQSAASLSPNNFLLNAASSSCHARSLRSILTPNPRRARCRHLRVHVVVAQARKQRAFGHLLRFFLSAILDHLRQYVTSTMHASFRVQRHLQLSRGRGLLQQFCNTRRIVLVHRSYAAHSALATHCTASMSNAIALFQRTNFAARRALTRAQIKTIIAVKIDICHTNAILVACRCNRISL